MEQKDYGKSKLEKQNEKLRRSLALINEAKEIGNETSEQMTANNEKLKNMTEKTGEINNKVQESKTIVDRMSSFWRRF
jgi:methyl-accepting chemotaxis protein